MGRSDIVGKPLSAMLDKRNATVITMHSKSDINIIKDYKPDVIICAMGMKK